jgi:prolyl-tRNA editing enzyme YbaK/EbsC (Cys-tRNA(Pro) deacylase)
MGQTDSTWKVTSMSLETVKAFFGVHAPELDVIETAQISATVAEAAAAHEVEPDQIAKTLSFQIGDRIVLVVTSGTARIDNAKAKRVFGAKATMLDRDTVERVTGHPVGGVCPFGLPTPLPVYCDVSLRAHPVVIAAAGAVNAAVGISPERLATITQATWVDVCRNPEPEVGSDTHKAI